MIHFVRYKVFNSVYACPPHHTPEADVRLDLMPSSSRANIWRWRVPSLVKVATFLLLGLMLLNLGVMAVARSGVIPQIEAPPQEYLPGRGIHQRCGDPNCTCNPYVRSGMSCVIHINDQDVYVYYDLSTNRIIHTIIAASKYEIGELIIAWGFPMGFHQSGTSIVVSWGERSAFLDTASFNPKSRIQSIEYALDPIQRSRWRGWLVKGSG